MANPMIRTIRRLTPAVVILIVLAQGALAAEPGSQSPGAISPQGYDVKLLMDGDYFPALQEGIRQARREIVLTAFFFKTAEGRDGQPEQILLHLLEAAGRGVRIDAVFERGPKGDNVSRDNERTARRLRKGGIHVCMDSPDITTHAKLAVIDRRYLFVGSHNLTQSALKYNHEVSVLIDSVPLAEEAIRYVRSLCH
jgi:phosphatidylserine/phosphatidylglycerophosphate/cardiolipin synthase-like enzyme